MRKTIIYILSAMVLLAGCDKNELAPVQNSDETITLTLSVRTPEASPMTKTMGEKPDITNLYIAIFDQGGYPVSYVQATDLTKVDDYSWTYKVSLPTSGDPRTLHFIANSPISSMDWEYEDNAIGNLVTTGKNDAYWQKIVLEDGIQSLAQVKDEIDGISLVRNFAKITVQAEADSGFTLTAMKVYNVPDRGYVAPKYAEGSFVENYNGTDYNTLKADYKGRTPGDATMVANSTNLIAAVSGIATDYVYERPLPTENAPFIIVYGQYRSTNYYYKIDLQDADSKYYPFLRNFRYKVDIKKVRAAGFETIEEAINSQGSGNITTVTEYENVTNIGYGSGRLFVDKIGVTVQQAGPITIKYKFIPDVSVTTNNVNNAWTSSAPTDANPVSLTLSEPLVGTANAVSSTLEVATSDVDGWRTVTLTALDPDPVYIKQQELIVLGKAKDGSLLQRKIVITVAPTFKLDVQCQKKVAGTKGTEMWVKIGLQEGLPESIFPVTINVESTKNSLNPAAGQSLPVTSGKSMSGNGKPAYMFSKTINWDEYSSAPSYEGTADVNGTQMDFTFKAIECDFVTNIAASACDVWAGGNSYFNNDYCFFINGDAFEFRDLSFSEALLGTTNRTTNFSFYAPEAKDITVTLTNGKWDGQSSFTYHAIEGTNTIGGIVLGDYGSGITAALSDGNVDYNDNSYTGYRTALIPAMSLTGNISDIASHTLGDAVAVKLGLVGSENTTAYFRISAIGATESTSKYTYSTSRNNGDRYSPQISSYSFDENTQTITITFARYSNVASNDISNYYYTVNTNSTSSSVLHSPGAWTFNYVVKDSDWQSNKVVIYLVYDGTFDNYNGTTCTVTRTQGTTTLYNYTISGPTSNTKVPLNTNVTENTTFSFKWLYNSGKNTMSATTKMENISTETVTNLTFN